MLQDLLIGLQDALAPLVGLLERNPVLRWSVIAVLWLLFVLRVFRGGGGGPRNGLFSWYDWLVIAVGGALVWTFQFGAGW